MEGSLSIITIFAGFGTSVFRSVSTTPVESPQTLDWKASSVLLAASLANILLWIWSWPAQCISLSVHLLSASAVALFCIGLPLTAVARTEGQDGVIGVVEAAAGRLATVLFITHRAYSGWFEVAVLRMAKPWTDIGALPEASWSSGSVAILAVVGISPALSRQFTTRDAWRTAAFGGFLPLALWFSLMALAGSLLHGKMHPFAIVLRDTARVGNVIEMATKWSKLAIYLAVGPLAGGAIIPPARKSGAPWIQWQGAAAIVAGSIVIALNWRPPLAGGAAK